MEIKTDLANSYGEVVFAQRKDEYVMELENWDGVQGIAISKEFFEAAVKEFGDKNEI
jgi:hypothetical protein